MEDDQIGCFLHEPTEFCDTLNRLESKADAIVGAAVPEMAIHDTAIVVCVSHFPQVAEICAELLRSDRGIFPAFPCRRLAGDVRNRAQGRFPDLPSFSCLLLVAEQAKTRRICAPGERFHQAARLRFSFTRCLGSEFREKPSASFRK